MKNVTFLLLCLAACGHSAGLIDGSQDTPPPLAAGNPIANSSKSDFQCPSHPERSEAGLETREPKPATVQKPSLTQGTFLAEVYLEERRGPILDLKQGNNHLKFYREHLQRAALSR